MRRVRERALEQGLLREVWRKCGGVRVPKVADLGDHAAAPAALQHHVAGLRGSVGACRRRQQLASVWKYRVFRSRRLVAWNLKAWGCTGWCVRPRTAGRCQTPPGAAASVRVPGFSGARGAGGFEAVSLESRVVGLRKSGLREGLGPPPAAGVSKVCQQLAFPQRTSSRVMKRVYEAGSKIQNVVCSLGFPKGAFSWGFQRAPAAGVS
eukprot:65839-Chlamydomonas_euryale.AAC.4